MVNNTTITFRFHLEGRKQKVTLFNFNDTHTLFSPSLFLSSLNLSKRRSSNSWNGCKWLAFRRREVRKWWI